MGDQIPQTSRMVRSNLFTWVYLALAATVQSASAGVTFHEAQAVYGPEIFPNIKTLAHCGNYRAIVTYSAGTDQLFLDKQLLDETQPIVDAGWGVSFREFGGYEDAYDISDIGCKFLPNGKLRIAGSAWNANSDHKFTFHIDFDTSRRTYVYSDTQPRRPDGSLQ